MHRFARVAAAVCTAVFVVLPSLGFAQQTAPSPAPSPGPTPGPGAISVPFADPYPSTYVPFASRATLIRNATILTAAGAAIRNGSILLRDGKIVAVGANVAAPADAVVTIDARGKYVTPGIIDIHT
ncbi:MAG: hypothetical protein QOD51_2938, partial [Candidatus Eremiobacteraeota bacterium]|nr:hypothetical protein [Candidatus Eremiobacteraeota bacterium]